jgi:FixJ family two-component response regulator
LFVDDRERAGCAHSTIAALHAAGFDVTTSIDDAGVVAIVVAVDAAGERGLPNCARSVAATSIPVVVVADDATPEVALRTAIDGAVDCVGTPMVVAAIADALASDAPALSDQRRRARVRALELLARANAEGADDTRCHVHLTRLEHGPVRTPSSSPSAEARLARCTSRQRELLDVITREGGVTNAATALGTSRNSIYASLRRIAHRLELRDCAELLRLLDPSSR